MLANLFKPAWKSNSIEKRLRAITAMDSTSQENQNILSQLAADDQEASIQIAAIQKLTSIDVLHDLSTKHADSPVGAESMKRLDELIGANSSLNKSQYLDLLKQYPALNLRIALHAEIPLIRTEAIQSLSSEQLLEVLNHSIYTDSRQLIAEKLNDIQSLEAARKKLRGKDKIAERIIKAKIDEIRKLERQRAENLAIVEKLVDEVEYLANHTGLPEFEARLLIHRINWDNLEFEINPQTRSRYQIARKIVDSSYTEQKLVEETLLAQQQLVVELETLIRKITGKDLSQTLEVLADTNTQLKQIKSNWSELSSKIQPEVAAQDKVDKISSALQTATRLVTQAAEILQNEDKIESVENESEVARQARTINGLKNKCQQLNAALKKLKWPAVYGELKLATELQQQLSDWQNTLKAVADEREQKLELLHKKISSIFRFSRTGNLSRAKQLCDKVEKGLLQFEGKDRTLLEERYQEARKTLGNMDDWKNFATEPKYINLCEAMEQLGKSKKHPDKLSSEMKDLQQQWKSLGHSEISDQYWERFKTAADKVYQPCAEFFDERHKIRKNHLEHRQQYVEQMRELLEATNWLDNPDYKAVQSSLRNISEHFASIKDVERNAGQKQWKQFSKYKEAVNAHLDVAYEANIALKHQLIKQVEALAEGAAKEENLSKLKALQTRWKHIGVTKRNQDQKAWTEFKKQGDLVYEKMQQLRQGQRDETDQQLNAYRDIIKEIQKLAKTATDLSEADQLFSILQAKYEELPELPSQLPEKLQDGIQRDYLHACNQYDKSHARIINNVHLQQIEKLRSKAALCAQLEALGDSPSEQQLQEISLQWDSIKLQDSALARRIEERRNSAQSPVDRDSIGAERRMLCIQLEIAKGIESPAEDKSLRMQYQLEQMNKSGLGLQILNNEEMLEKMELDWLCMPGTKPDLQQQLDQRFHKVFRSN